MGFNFETIMQAHDSSIRALAYSHNDDWLLSADQDGVVTASDDATLKIFDFAGGLQESTLTGHGWEAKSVDWHPNKGLLVSGSKDHTVKLWDPRTGR